MFPAILPGPSAEHRHGNLLRLEVRHLAPIDAGYGCIFLQRLQARGPMAARSQGRPDAKLPNCVAAGAVCTEPSSHCGVSSACVRGHAVHIYTSRQLSMLFFFSSASPDNPAD